MQELLFTYYAYVLSQKYGELFGEKQQAFE